MSSWKIIMPTAASNIVLNPSAEIATPANYAGVDSATVTRSSARARFGDWSYKIVSGGTNRGISLTTATMGNAIHYVTFYAFDNIATPYVSLDAGANGVANVCTVIGGATGNWVRWGFAVSAAQANGNATVRIYNPDNETWYIDAVQVEQSSYWTTYIDGNRAGPIYGENTGTLYYWSGHSHASTSLRGPQERGGGRIMDLKDDYGLSIQQVPGAGMPPLRHNLQGLALQPGAAFQSTKILPRELILRAETHASSIANLHSLRKDIIDLIKPDGVRGAQPFLLGYSGANSGKTVYCQFRYSDGMGIGEVDGGNQYVENQIPITLQAVSPYWFEDNRETSTLSFVQTLTAVNRVIGRVEGVWGKLATGFNSDVMCSAYDPTTGRIYFGGFFTTGNSVTLNHVGYWNPVTATFTAMDAGVNNNVYAIAVAPNGDVWIGGQFTTVGSGATAAKGLAKWVLATSSWSVPTASATLTGIYALVIDANGDLYGGGDFLNFGGAAAADYIFKYTTAGVFSGLGTGTNSDVLGLAVWIDGTTIFVAGTFSSANSVTVNKACYWNGTTFVPLGDVSDPGLGGGDAYEVAVARNGDVYYGGTFTKGNLPVVNMNKIGKWNGTGWQPLSNGITGTNVRRMYFGPDGLLYVAGTYTAIGPFTTKWPGVWNGSNWQLLDLDSVAATPVIRSFLVLPNGNLYLGGDMNNETLITGTPTTDVVSTNTAAVFPNFTIVGPTSGTMTLQEIRNASSNQTMRFNLVVNLGETVKINLQPGSKQVVSSWRGVLPGQPLPTSDFANFIMQPTRADAAATNTVFTFVTGTTTGALFLMHWIPSHWSVDGAAA